MSFTIGINYWPIQKGIRFWREFDLGEIREDLARIHEQKFQQIRVFLMWEDFQPEMDVVNLRCLDKLVALAQQAWEHHLKLWPVLFTGHVAGANWLPGWMLDSSVNATRWPTVCAGQPAYALSKNPFSSEQIMRAQQLLLNETLAALGNHPAVACWDLGNAPSRLYHPQDLDQGRRWLGNLVDIVHQRGATVPTTLTLSHEDLEHAHGLGPAQVAEFCDWLGLRVRPDEIGLEQNPHEPLLPLFLAALCRFLSGDKDVWISELGIPSATQWTKASKVQDPETLHFVAERWVRQMQAYGFPGIQWWCYGDISSRWWRRFPFDQLVEQRAFGLWDEAWHPKPLLDALLSSTAHHPNETLPMDWLDVDPQQYWRRPSETIRHLYQRFRKSLSS